MIYHLLGHYYLEVCFIIRKNVEVVSVFYIIIHVFYLFNCYDH